MAPHPLSHPSSADPALAHVRALAAPLCAAHGVQLVDVAWGTEYGTRVLRVTIERRVPDGQAGWIERSSAEGWGVTLEHCADLSRDLSHSLDQEENAVPGSYNLEVSSPGLERSLLCIEDFLRFQGKLARAKLVRPAPDGQKLLRGQIVSVTGADGDEQLTMLVDGRTLSVPFGDVAEANLVFELAPTPKKAPGTRSPGTRSQGERSPGSRAAGSRSPGTRSATSRSTGSRPGEPGARSGEPGMQGKRARLPKGKRSESKGSGP